MLAWCCVIAGGLELWARVFTGGVPQAPATICFSLTRARETYTSVYERHMKPWPAPMPTHPPMENYGVQDDAQRQETAEARGEWALLFDNQSNIVRTYGSPPAGRQQWSSHAAPGQALTELAVPVEIPQVAEEMKGRLKGLLETGFSPNMAMDLPAEGDAAPMRVDIRFVPVRYDGSVRQGIAAIRPSIWMPNGKKHFAPRAALLDDSNLMMMERFTANNLGYRGPDVVLPKPAGVLRIVCVGGSTTVEGYDDRLTYPAMLQEMLRDRFSGAADRVEVVNCGVFGLASPEEMDMQPEILAMEPDIVIYYNGINDLFNHYKFWIESGEAWPTAGDLLRSLLGKSAFLRRFWRDRLIPTDAAFERFIRSTSIDNLEKLFSAYQARGVAVTACSFAGPEPEVLSRGDCLYADTQFVPQWFQDMDLRTYTHMRGLFNATLKGLCRDKNLLYIPVAEEQRAGFDQFTDLCHMTPKGIETKAQIVFNHIAPLVAERLGIK